MLTFHIITLFPEALTSYVSASVVGRAVREKKIKIKFYNPFDFAQGKPRSKKGEWFYRRVDDKPYGGGPGMVMQAEPVLKAIESALRKIRSTKSKTRNKFKIIIFSPNKKQFTNAIAANYVKKYQHLILICGRYEGIDARVKKILKAEEVSIGPYVLTGGELPAMVVLDAVARQLPGVLGKDESVEERRVSSSEVYTRPEILKYRGKKYRVPKVMLSGHHQKIEEWKERH